MMLAGNNGIGALVADGHVVDGDIRQRSKLQVCCQTATASVKTATIVGWQYLCTVTLTTLTVGAQTALWTH